MVAAISHSDNKHEDHVAAEELETARLRLRMFRSEDLDELCAITRDPEAMRFIGDGHPLTRKETEANLSSIIRAFRRRGFGRWAVVKKDGGALVGYCGLSHGIAEVGVELAYLFSRAEWGRGLATEAAAATLRYGFERLRADSIAGLTRHENLRSRRVLERLNMRYLRPRHFYGYSCAWYAISRSDWRPDNSIYRVTR
jgi:ribosomal-protein-alanine N-acetyltransferase